MPTKVIDRTDWVRIKLLSAKEAYQTEKGQTKSTLLFDTPKDRHVWVLFSPLLKGGRKTLTNISSHFEAIFEATKILREHEPKN